MAHHNDWSRWFAISSPLPPFCCPGFSFIGGVSNEWITKLGCENIFAESHTEHHWRCSHSGNKPSSSSSFLFFAESPWRCHVSHIPLLHAGFAVVFNWACVWSAGWISIFTGTIACLIWSQGEPARTLVGTFNFLSEASLWGLLVNHKNVHSDYERSNQKTNLRFLLPSRCWFTQ